MAATWGEMFPPTPTFTEKDIPDQHGRVFIMTGGSAGIGYEVAKALFHLNGRVYIASRSEATAKVAISSIRASSPAPNQVVKSGKGEILYLHLDLSDLSTIKASAMEFLSKENRLDVIWHNAGVMIPSDDTPTKQGHHIQLGINLLGPFLFQHYLTPLCLQTASLPSVPKASTRIIFVSSSAHRSSPTPDGIDWSDINLSNAIGFRGNAMKYGQSKAANVMQAHEFARRYCAQGVVSLSLHPGALTTGLQDNAPGWFNTIFGRLRHPPHMGALTELFAGLVPLKDGEEKMLEDGGRNGAYVLPWGRFGKGAKHVFEGLEKRGTGEKLWKVSEEMVKEFL